MTAMAFNLDMTVDACMAYNYAHARFYDLDTDARSQCVGKDKRSRQLCKQYAINLLQQ